MSELAGTYILGPDSAQLKVLTGTAGPAARAGHNLEIAVDEWQATLELQADGIAKLSLKADGASLRVIGSRGSILPLSDNDRVSIGKTINDKVLKRSTVRFHSTSISAGASQRVTVVGMLTLLGTARPLEFYVSIGAGGEFSGEARFKQTAWGIKQYAVMGGALKVADEVTVIVTGQLPQPQ